MTEIKDKNVRKERKKEDLSRRDFIRRSIMGAAGACLLSGLGGLGIAKSLSKKDESNAVKSSISGDERFVADAKFWEPLGGNRIRCKLCPMQCVVPEGGRGICEVRENREGKYKTLVYSRPVSMHVDPIEKKPLFHFLPTTKAFSIATAGCNIECKFCQNWQISQARPSEIKAEYAPPSKIVELAKKSGSPSIAFTYSEPTIFYEYMFDTAAEAKKNGVNAVMISNGFINEKPMRELCKHLSAVKIDLKAFTEEFYRDVCAGQLQPVLNTLKTLKDEGMWFEIVVLLIPTLNDSDKEIRDMSKWIVDNLGPNAPVHFTKFHPTYKIKNLPVTPIKTMERAREIAKDEGVRFPYLGNVWNHKYENTFCPECDKLLIRRQGYFTKIEGLKDGKCANCGEVIPGFWKNELA